MFYFSLMILIFFSNVVMHSNEPIDTIPAELEEISGVPEVRNVSIETIKKSIEPKNTSKEYIEIRDMSKESAKIQRLLGQIDALSVLSEENPPSVNDDRIAMLTIMTMGLAIATTGDMYRRYGYKPPVYTYHKNYYYKQPSKHPAPKPIPPTIVPIVPQNFPMDHIVRPVPPSRYNKAPSPAVILGTTIATIGAVGLIATEVAKEQEKQDIIPQNEQQRKDVLKKIEVEINTILSNLVSTDKDFIIENKILEDHLVQTADRNILEIANVTSNDIYLLLQKQQNTSNDFIQSTNKLVADLVESEKSTLDAISFNINMMDGSKKDNEIAKLNKSLEKNLVSMRKDTRKLIQKEVRDFNKSYPKLIERNQSIIVKLKEVQNESILKEVENIATQKSKLFQLYIDKYIDKLVVY